MYAACLFGPSLCRVAVDHGTTVNVSAHDSLSFTSRYLEQVSRKSEQYNAKYGNKPCRAHAAFWFWNLAQLFNFKRSMRPKADDVCRIGFLITGGIGDMIVALNYLQNFHRFLGENFTFDVYVQKKRGYCEIIQTLCREQDFVKQVLPSSQLKRDYDLYVKLVRCPEILYFNEAKIRSLSPKLHHWCLAVNDFHQDNPVVYRYSTHGDYVGIKLAILHGRNRLQQADVSNTVQVESIFQPKILADTQETLAKFSLGNKCFITMQRGVGGGDSNVSTRLWSIRHYETLARLIKDRMPEVPIVQVGTKNKGNLAIQGVDMDLRDQTTYEDVMVLMQQSSCHIDCDCGLVHLRHFLRGGPSVVLFGPTDKQFLGYAENINLQSDACIGGCEWITAKYAMKCARGLSENVCLTRLAPEVVFEHVLQLVNSVSYNANGDRMYTFTV